MNLILDYTGFAQNRMLRKCKLDGVQYIFRFDNNYGASVVKFTHTYGYESDLWELAVIKFDENGDYDLVYDTPVADDVVGHLTDGEVCWYLGRIRDLPVTLAIDSH